MTTSFEIFDIPENYQNALGGTPSFTQDFESYASGQDLDGVEFLPGVFATSNLQNVEVFLGSGDRELFVYPHSSAAGSPFYDLNFTQPYNAVGFDIEAFDPDTTGPAVVDIFFSNGESTSIDIFPTNLTESDPIFFGVVADRTIDRIRVTEGPEIGGFGNEEISLDNFVIANLPTQPSTLIVDILVDEIDGNLSPGDVSLREAIAYTQAGGTVNFSSGLIGGTIDLTLGELVVNKALTINGLGADNLTIRAANNSRVFKIDDGNSSTSLEVDIQRLTIADGGTDEYGGGIFNAENLAISDMTFRDNFGGFGGGVHNEGEMTIEDSLFVENRSTDGAGINNQGTMSIFGTTISNNGLRSTPSFGGGILNTGDLYVADSTISGNAASVGGAGISNSSDGFLTLVGSTIRDNVVDAESEDGEGGGIGNNGYLFVDNSTIASNKASFGAGVHNNGTFYLLESTIRENTVHNFPASGTFSTGGGIFNGKLGSAFIGDSTISGNQANRGGGIRNGGFLYALNSTLSENQGAARGGALFNTQFGSAYFDFSTIANNEANIARNLLDAESTGGGGVYNLGEVNLYNTIVADNVDAGFTPGDASPDIFSQTPFGNTNPASLTSFGGNLVGILNENANLTPAATDIVGTNTNPIDPKLGPLQNNGGSTETHALLAGSPAIDTADLSFPLSVDQRGVDRPQGNGFDIGAFELETSPNDGTVFGTSDDNLLIGTPNTDIIDGLAGNDEIRGRQQNDLLIGGEGNDVVSGQAGNDTLQGGDGDDRLYGEAGDDILEGSAGNDTLVGWKGNDVVSGGEGEDLFILKATHGTDTIADFVVGEDRIWMKDGLGFSDLSITQESSNTLISYNGETLAILNNVEKDSLTAVSFV